MNRTLIWVGATAGVAALIVACVILYFVLSGEKPSAPAADNNQAQQPANDTPLNKPRFRHMQLQAQYAGPMADTLVQRWRDPVDGTVCYIYLPIVVHHTKSAVPGYVEYGGNYVGSITCMPPPATALKTAASKPEDKKDQPEKKPADTDKKHSSD